MKSFPPNMMELSEFRASYKLHSNNNSYPLKEYLNQNQGAGSRKEKALKQEGKSVKGRKKREAGSRIRSFLPARCSLPTRASICFCASGYELCCAF